MPSAAPSADKRLLRRIRFRAGAGDGEPGTELSPGTLTVLVGPNNSGKSRALLDLEAIVSRAAHSVVVESVEVTEYSRAAFEELLTETATQTRAGRFYCQGFTDEGNSKNATSIDGYQLNSAGDDPSWTRQIAAGYLTLRLGGAARIRALDEKPIGDLQNPPSNTLAVLMRSTELRTRFRSLVHEAFEEYPILDLTNGGQIRVRLSERLPTSETEELSFTREAIAFQRSARLLTEYSDGVRAYCGMVALLLTAGARLILIDEPEAFLHPVLARRLGATVAELAAASGASVVAASHSPDFLLGCVESGRSCHVVRLTYERRVATARLLPQDSLRTLMRDPLLRSVNALGALFARGAVVAEGDSDRVFYQEINHRLLAERQGASHTAYLHSQSKQAAWRIVDFLRSVGVPTAAILDLDAVKEGGENWSAICRACRIPQLMVQALGTQRARVLGALDNADPTWKTAGGVGVLASSDREGAENLLAQLAAYGLFIVPVGEVEAWLRHLAVPGKKRDWAAAMLERLGADDDPGYVTPADGDVWDFIRSVARWIADPNRRGMR